MKPEKAQQELQKRIQKSGTPMSGLTPAQGIRLMLDFYRDVRAKDCELDDDGDMLLFQWGTYDFGKGRSFRFDITRQFIVEDEDDSPMSQLSFVFHFAPSAQLGALKGNRWCGTLDELDDFETFITGADAYRAVAAARPEKVTLDYRRV